MKEHFVENGELIDLENLKSNPMTQEEYAAAHKGLPVVCHDVAVKYKGGILLLTRNQHPAKNELCVIGGRLQRGMPMLESLKQKAKEECNLEIKNIREIGTARTLFKTDPFDHGKGTDTVNFMFFAEGEGELKLDKLHTDPLILKKKEYTHEFRAKLHPYVQDILDMAFEKS